MRKPFFLGMLICLILCLAAMSQIHQLNHLSNKIKIDEMAADLALLLIILISFMYSKDIRLQLILLVFALSPDALSYSQLTQGQYIYLSHSVSYLLAGITVLALFSQYKMTIFSFIIMAHYQLFMAIAYYLAAGLGIDEVAKSFMFVNYKAILYGIHLLIIGSITEWTIIDRIRINIDYYIRVFRIRLGVYFVGRTF
jgi:hypothetical protein